MRYARILFLMLLLLTGRGNTVVFASDYTYKLEVIYPHDEEDNTVSFVLKIENHTPRNFTNRNLYLWLDKEGTKPFFDKKVPALKFNITNDDRLNEFDVTIPWEQLYKRYLEAGFYDNFWLSPLCIYYNVEDSEGKSIGTMGHVNVVPSWYYGLLPGFSIKAEKFDEPFEFSLGGYYKHGDTPFPYTEQPFDGEGTYIRFSMPNAPDPEEDGNIVFGAQLSKYKDFHEVTEFNIYDTPLGKDNPNPVVGMYVDESHTAVERYPFVPRWHSGMKPFDMFLPGSLVGYAGFTDEEIAAQDDFIVYVRGVCWRDGHIMALSENIETVECHLTMQTENAYEEPKYGIEEDFSDDEPNEPAKPDTLKSIKYKIIKDCKTEIYRHTKVVYVPVTINHHYELTIKTFPEDWMELNAQQSTLDSMLIKYSPLDIEMMLQRIELPDSGALYVYDCMELKDAKELQETVEYLDSLTKQICGKDKSWFTFRIPTSEEKTQLDLILNPDGETSPDTEGNELFYIIADIDTTEGVKKYYDIRETINTKRQHLIFIPEIRTKKTCKLKRVIVSEEIKIIR